MESKMRKRDTYHIDLAEEPEIGFQQKYFGHDITVVKVEDYTRKDGSPSKAIHWRLTDGRVGISGLRAKGLNFRSAK